jgi:hypothetical protein
MNQSNHTVAARLNVEALEEREMLSGTPLSADSDRSLTTGTAWWCYTGVDASFLSAKVRQDNARITGLHVDSSSPVRFTATLVKNTGDYAHGWWWYHGLTSEQVQSTLTSNHARITDMDTYFVNGQRRFAVVEEPNTGKDAKAWWWYYNVSPSFVSAQLTANKARLIDIKREANGNLDVVMVANTGSDARTWWWYTGISASDMVAKVNQNHARVTVMERQDDGKFSVIMEQGQGEAWWYYYGVSASAILDMANTDHARVTDLQRYTVNGHTYFALVMLQNGHA